VGGHSLLVLQHFVVAGVFEIVRGLVQRLLGRLSRFIALNILGRLKLGRLTALDQRLSLVLLRLASITALFRTLAGSYNGGCIGFDVAVGLKFVNEGSGVESGNSSFVVQGNVGVICEFTRNHALVAVDYQVRSAVGHLLSLSGVVYLRRLQRNLSDVRLVGKHTYN
jgi:hypothetical protein